MKHILRFLAVLVSVAVRYFVILKLYGYFLIPLGFPLLSIPMVMGVILTVSFVFNSPTYLDSMWKQHQREVLEIEEAVGAETITSVLTSLLVWGMAAIVLLFI